MVNNQANMWKYYYIATAGQTVFSGADTGNNVLVVNSGSEEVTLNGVVLKPGTDYTISNNTITLTTGATLGSELNVTVYGMFNVANTYSMSQVDNKITTVQQGVYGFKNHIINGNFDIWQRGTSQTTSGYGSDDRWANYNTGSTKTHSRVACTDTERVLFSASAFSRTVVNSVAGAGNAANKLQHIEDVTKLAGKTVTLSFWAKADSSKNIAVEFVQRFGTGGSPSAEVQGVGSQLVSLTTTWQKKTVTVTLPSIVGKTLGTDGVHTTSTALAFWFDAGSEYNARAANLGQQSGTFDIAQVQLEEGSVATPFEQRHVGLELSLCQRYYEEGACSYHCNQVYDNRNNSTLTTTFSMAQPKRIIPTFSKMAFSSGTLNSVTCMNDKRSVLVYTLNSSVMDAVFLTYYAASAEL